MLFYYVLENPKVHTYEHVFTTVYEQGSFEPVARLVQLASQLEQKRLAEIAYETRRFVRIGESDVVINQRIADKSQPILKIYHYHCNHLGTPQELSDDKGDIIWLSYDRAWGGNFDSLYKQQFVDNFAVSENELQPFKFQGQSLDIETGLHYNRFRYYDSDVGMFVSRDPIELEGGLNTFAYVPNPVNWIDPSGLQNQRITKCKCNDECPAGTMNPDKIHFMQSSAKNQTGDYTVIENANALSNGTLQPEILKIKIWKDNNDKIWTLDHRRLAAFKIAKKCVPYEWASQKEIDSQMWKMTTKTGGQTMKLKLGDGKSIIVR
jgi:RHS repeat-associated protein